jgi:hypothetical protein
MAYAPFLIDLLAKKTLTTRLLFLGNSRLNSKYSSRLKAASRARFSIYANSLKRTSWIQNSKLLANLSKVGLHVVPALLRGSYLKNTLLKS